MKEKKSRIKRQLPRDNGMMKFLTQIGIISSLVVSIQCLDVKVYKFPSSNTENTVPHLDSKDAILNLANQFDISSNFKLDSLKDYSSLSIGQDELFGDLEPTEAQEIILIVQGVDTDKFNIDSKPIFETTQDSQLIDFLSSLPNEYDDYRLNQLSNEINIVESSTDSNVKLNHIWNHYFQMTKDTNKKLNSIWSDLKDAFNLSQDDKEAHLINLINDESFINEMSQFKFLVEDSQTESKKIIINLKSLSQIWKKTGLDSLTYQNSMNILSNLINENLVNNANGKFKSTIIVLTSSSSSSSNFELNPKSSISHMQKRQLSARKSTSNCYTSEESCLVSTSSCSNNGVCSKNANDCWSCSCSASYNETTKSTTYWQGSDCSKKDVSVEFNLLLWFSVFMVVATILGVKLMFDVGNEDLPGVLSAATASKKSNA